MESDNFTEKQIRTAQLAQAFSNPANIAILEFIIWNQQCISGKLVDEIPLDKETVSKHLKILKDADLIKGEIEGDNICYCIKEKTFLEAQVMFNSLFLNFNQKANCCVDSR